MVSEQTLCSLTPDENLWQVSHGVVGTRQQLRYQVYVTAPLLRMLAIRPKPLLRDGGLPVRDPMLPDGSYRSMAVAQIEADATYDEFPIWCNAELNPADWKTYLTLRTTAVFRLSGPLRSASGPSSLGCRFAHSNLWSFDGSAQCMERLLSSQPSPRVRTEQVPAVPF